MPNSLEQTQGCSVLLKATNKFYCKVESLYVNLLSLTYFGDNLRNVRFVSSTADDTCFLQMFITCNISF